MEPSRGWESQSTSPTAKICCWLVPVIFVHGDTSARVGLGRPAAGEIQFIHVALAADGIEQSLAGNFFLAFQV